MLITPLLLVVVQDVAERVAGAGGAAALLGHVLEAKVDKSERDADDAEGDEGELGEGGEDIKEANIGSMAHSVGKVVVTDAIAMGDDDVKTIEAIKAKGVKLEARKVPADASKDVDEMLKKAKSELAAQ